MNILKETTIQAVEKAFAERGFPPDCTGFQTAYAKAGDDEKICLKYYYAFMPSSDLAAYDASLFLKIIRQTLKVRRLNLFSAEIPDDVFLNFVLHYRVNNENIEYHREIFFDELRPRIEGKRLYDAVVEVNYWCREKASYIAANPRTVSPLTLIKNALGRCGEQSTFTVSALRSAGIPARQVYTPRWAHCDSNHAWVEAYVDGRWHFLGACEPEPVLDRAWFTGPASRGALMHARVFSTIAGDEEIICSTALMMELNLTKRYAETKTLEIDVGNAAGDVTVYLELPNYCELFPITTLVKHKTAVSLGYCDLMLRVSDGKRYVTRKVDAGETSVQIDFSKAVLYETENRTLRFTPPPQAEPAEQERVPEALRLAHEERVKKCDAIRLARTAGFVCRKDEKPETWGEFLADTAEILSSARGNRKEILAFLDYETPIPFKYKVLLLKSLEKKDLTDSECAVLMEHLECAYPYRDRYFEEVFTKYLLCPRVGFEMISPYRRFIPACFDEETKRRFVKNPAEIYHYIEAEIADAAEEDYRALIAPPAGLLRLKWGSLNSRKTLFVAICRSLGIAARCNPQDTGLEYWEEGGFKRVTAAPLTPAKTGRLTLVCGEKLEYSKNLSIGRLIDGGYQTLRFWGETLNVFGLEEGRYRIITGDRLSDGTMLLNLYFTEIKAGDEVSLEVTIPRQTGIKDAAGNNITLGDFNFSEYLTLGRMIHGNTIAAYIEPSREPTEHLLRELLDAAETIRERKIGLALIANAANSTLERIRAAFPAAEILVLEKDAAAFAETLAAELGFFAGNYPIMALCNGDRRVCYYSQGYNVGSVGMALQLDKEYTGLYV